MEEEEKKSICLECVYSAQPYNYYPIVCVRKRIKEMYYDKEKCRNFKKRKDD